MLLSDEPIDPAAWQDIPESRWQPVDLEAFARHVQGPLVAGERVPLQLRFERAGLVVRALGDGVRVSIGEEESVAKLLRSSREVVAPLS